jgi:hypothetical protein
MYTVIVATLLMSLLFTLLAVFVFERRGPWGSAWTVFLLLFLSLWVISIYIAPIGPVYQGVSWVPLLVATILIGTLLLVSFPDSNHWRDESIDSSSGTGEQQTKPVRVNSFFWILIILLITAIITGMMFPRNVL